MTRKQAMFSNDLLDENEIQHNIDYMTKSHLRNVMQLAVFATSSDRLYAINISKIQSFLIKEEVELLQPPSGNEYVTGLINIRGEIVSIVNFDKWIGDNTTDEDQRIIIVCNYNQKKIGLMVKDIIRIEEKASDELRVPASRDPKISYVTEVQERDNDTKKKMCIVFDAERLLYDANVSDKTSKTTIYDIDSFEIASPDTYAINSNKLVLVAEDSQIVIEKLNEFLTKLELNFEIYENGEDLINRIMTLDPQEIGLVITDIEMPIRNGYQVIKYIKQESVYGNVPVLSLTSMTNQGVKDKVMELGALDLVNKSDLKLLFNYIKEILEGELQ
ncbi:MAG: chemotaxis protein CheV [Sulfurospirillum sp.]|nr:MAG: chemotaxis protein CheV [Sulfurospirillum sp.]